MIQLPQIEARIDRLRDLTVNLGKEVTAQKAVEGLLLPLERRQYLDGLQSALAELDAARVVLVGVATHPPKRICALRFRTLFFGCGSPPQGGRDPLQTCAYRKRRRPAGFVGKRVRRRRWRVAG
jgi:hypothetical protein